MAQSPPSIRESLENLDAEESQLEAAGTLPERLPGECRMVWALRSSTLFSILPPRELVRLARSSHERTLAAKVELRLGDEDRVYVVESGGIKVVQSTDDGRRLIEAVVDPGGFFGPLAGPAPTSTYVAEALERSELLVIPREALRRAIQDHAELAQSVIQVLDDQRRKLSRRLSSLLFKSVELRVVEAILDMCRHYPDRCQHGMAVDVRLSQQDLAELVGTSRESVSRVISNMEKRMYVHKIGRTLCILNLNRLERLARTHQAND